MIAVPIAINLIVNAMIIVVFGLPGSGKSYFAERLAKKIGAEYVNSDRVRKEMISRRTYSEQEKAAVYDALLEKTRMAVREKRDIVLDATFHKDDRRKTLVKEFDGPGRILFIEIRADEDLTRHRLLKKRTDSDADFSVYKLLLKEWEPMQEQHLILHSTDDNIDSLLDDALKYLEKNR